MRAKLMMLNPLGSILISVLLGCFFPYRAMAQYSDPRYTNTIAQTSRFILDHMGSNEVVGLSIALVDSNRIVWADGFGMANIENNIPMTYDKVLMLGSISKTLTTVALLEQYDDGLVQLDVSITNYLSEFTMLPRYTNQIEGMTVRRLLNHHSGIPGDIYNGAVAYGAYWDGFAGWLLSYFQEDYPTYAPGCIASYCNSGFVLAGEIIARIGNTNLIDYMDQNLFTPLGMTHTSFLPITNNLATGYANSNAAPAYTFNMPATGGAYTSAEDMAQLIMMLLGGGTHTNGAVILDPDTVTNEMLTAEFGPADTDSYFIPGLGWDSVDDPVMRYAGRTAAKDGATGVFSTFCEILYDQELGVIVLMNSPGEFKYDVVRKCLQLATEEKGGPSPSAPTMPVAISITNRTEIAGKYAKAGGYDEITANPDGTLKWVIDAGFDPLEKTLFYTNNAFGLEGYDFLFAFTNVACAGTNFTLMVQHGSAGSEREETIYGGYVVANYATKFEPAPISVAWSNRLGVTYVVNNLIWNDALWSAPEMRLWETNGILFIQYINGRRMLVPMSDTSAFIPGFNNRDDSSVRILMTNGMEVVQIGGCHAIALTNIPAIDLNSGTNTHIAFHETTWFKFVPPEANIEYEFQVPSTGSVASIVLRLFDDDSISGAPLATGDGMIRWLASGTNPLYIAITASADTDYAFLASTYPLLLREVRDLGNREMMLQWQGETGTTYTISAANFLGIQDLFYPLYTGITANTLLVGFTNAVDPASQKYYRIDTGNDVGIALLISDIHLNPYISTNVVTQLVAASYTEWRDILAPYTNSAFFTVSEWGEHVTDYKLFNSALDNALAVVPSPDLIIFPGDYPVHEFRVHYTNYTGDVTENGYRSFMYKLFGFVGSEISRRWPNTPVFTILGNNDTYLSDYELTPEGAFLTDTAGLIFTNGMSNACAFSAFADDFKRGGYYSVGIGTSAQMIAFSTAFMSSRYTNEAGFFTYDPATNALHFLDMELDACAVSGKPAWVLLHILPGADAYATYAEWGGQGNLTNVVEFWKNDYLEEFMRIIADHSNIVRQVFCGHTHMREFRLISDPVASNVIATLNVTPGVDYTHGNNPGFQIMTYDRNTYDVESIVTYALSRTKYEGQTGQAAWDLVYSYNNTFNITNFTAPEMEGLYVTLTNTPGAYGVYGNIYVTGSGVNEITTNNWSVYSTAIRWLTETQFLDNF